MDNRIFWLVVGTVAGLVAHDAEAEIPWKEASIRLRHENARLQKQPGGRQQTYFVICTLYYTPIETGFTAAGGFDVRKETRPGLQGRKYPRDFLLAVKKEGVGRIKQPVGNCNYIRYKEGRSYNFAAQPVDRSTVPLIARSSAATRRGQKSFALGNELLVSDRFVREHSRIIAGELPIPDADCIAGRWIFTGAKTNRADREICWHVPVVRLSSMHTPKLKLRVNDTMRIYSLGVAQRSRSAN